MHSVPLLHQQAGGAVFAPELSVEVPAPLREAVRELLEVKHTLDALLQSGAGTRVVDHIFPISGPDKAIQPHDFVAHVLPFYRFGLPVEGGCRYKAMVPTAAAMGASWRWSPQDRTAEDLDNAFAITDQAFLAASPGHAPGECPQFSYLNALGLFIAHEGKNRVALFRERGVEHIPALVSDEEYPASERLELFDLRRSAHGTVLAVLDGRFVERLRAPALIDGVLDAYGVSRRSAWPEHYLPLDAVLADLADPSRERRRDRATGVADMAALAATRAWRRERDADEDVIVTVPLLLVATVRTPLPRQWAMLGLAIVSLCAGYSLSVESPDLRTAISVALAACAALAVVPLLPVFRCRVRDLADIHRHHHLKRLGSERAAADEMSRPRTPPNSSDAGGLRAGGKARRS